MSDKTKDVYVILEGTEMSLLTKGIEEALSKFIEVHGFEPTWEEMAFNLICLPRELYVELSVYEDK